MVTVVFLAAKVYLGLLVFYTLYIAAINIVRDWGELHTWVKLAAWPIPAVMLPVDAFFQLTLFVLVFWDLPREWLVTHRLARYRDQSAYQGTWRGKIATAICTQALNPFDPTRHHC